MKPPVYLVQKVRLDKLFGGSGKLPETEQEILAAIDNCDSDLSPENLCCDGGLPAARVAVKRREINQARSYLESKLGRKVEPRY